MDKKERFQDRFLEFGAEVLVLVAQLPRTMAARHIADQLLRSGTSVGANVHEARSAESRADFVHKLQIALKEIREVAYWLALVGRIGVVKEESLQKLVGQCEELTAILAKSVITAKKNVGQSSELKTQDSVLRKTSCSLSSEP